MRKGWIEDVMRAPLDSMVTLNGYAEWTPIHGERVQGRARLALCQSAGRRIIGITISRYGRTRMRGLFVSDDVDLQSRTADHIDVVVATGSDHTASFLRFSGPGGDRLVDFIAC